jgi:hypothetical protein
MNIPQYTYKEVNKYYAAKQTFRAERADGKRGYATADSLFNLYQKILKKKNEWGWTRVVIKREGYDMTQEQYLYPKNMKKYIKFIKKERLKS